MNEIRSTIEASIAANTLLQKEVPNADIEDSEKLEIEKLNIQKQNLLKSIKESIQSPSADNNITDAEWAEIYEALPKDLLYSILGVNNGDDLQDVLLQRKTLNETERQIQNLLNFLTKPISSFLDISALYTALSKNTSEIKNLDTASRRSMVILIKERQSEIRDHYFAEENSQNQTPTSKAEFRIANDLSQKLFILQNSLLATTTSTQYNSISPTPSPISEEKSIEEHDQWDEYRTAGLSHEQIENLGAISDIDIDIVKEYKNEGLLENNYYLPFLKENIYPSKIRSFLALFSEQEQIQKSDILHSENVVQALASDIPPEFIHTYIQFNISDYDIDYEGVKKLDPKISNFLEDEDTHSNNIMILSYCLKNDIFLFAEYANLELSGMQIILAHFSKLNPDQIKALKENNPNADLGALLHSKSKALSPKEMLTVEQLAEQYSWISPDELRFFKNNNPNVSLETVESYVNALSSEILSNGWLKYTLPDLVHLSLDYVQSFKDFGVHISSTNIVELGKAPQYSAEIIAPLYKILSSKKWDHYGPPVDRETMSAFLKMSKEEQNAFSLHFSQGTEKPTKDGVLHLMNAISEGRNTSDIIDQYHLDKGFSELAKKYNIQQFIPDLLKVFPDENSSFHNEKIGFYIEGCISAKASGYPDDAIRSMIEQKIDPQIMADIRNAGENVSDYQKYPLFLERDDSEKSEEIRNTLSLLNFFEIPENKLLQYSQMTPNGHYSLLPNKLDAIIRTEVSGEKKTFLESRGITFPARYPIQIFKSMIESKESQTKPLAVIINTKSDHNKAFQYSHEVYLQIAEHYAVQIYEVTTDDEFLRKIKENTNIKLLIIGGHGDKSGIDFGGREEGSGLATDDKTKLKVDSLSNILTPDANIILQSCSTGKGGVNSNNIAKTLHTSFDRTVFAPNMPSNIKNLNFSPTGELEDVIFFDEGDVREKFE